MGGLGGFNYAPLMLLAERRNIDLDKYKWFTRHFESEMTKREKKDE